MRFDKMIARLGPNGKMRYIIIILPLLEDAIDSKKIERGKKEITYLGRDLFILVTLSS